MVYVSAFNSSSTDDPCCTKARLADDVLQCPRLETRYVTEFLEACHWVVDLVNPSSLLILGICEACDWKWEERRESSFKLVFAQGSPILHSLLFFSSRKDLDAGDCLGH